MRPEVTLDLEALYKGDTTAKLARLQDYVDEAASRVSPRGDVVLTGRAPVWLYLAVAHHLHGVVCKLWYDSPVTGRVLIWDHSPD